MDKDSVGSGADYSAGPRTVVLWKGDRGYGFTLRHFIVYPPSDDKGTFNNILHAADAEGCGQFSACSLEPMDTIFVKHVKEGGPADISGLRTGDRIVSVNGETVSGKSYQQVVQLIQESNSILQLLVVPKEDDILQLYFSGTAYGTRRKSQQQQLKDEPFHQRMMMLSNGSDTSVLTCPSSCAQIVSSDVDASCLANVDSNSEDCLSFAVGDRACEQNSKPASYLGMPSQFLAEQSVLPESIINRLKTTFEKKEEFLLRQSLPVLLPSLSQTFTPSVPQYCCPLKNAVDDSSFFPLTSSAPLHLSNRSSDSDDSMIARHPKQFVSNLSRIQENIPITAHQSGFADYQSSRIDSHHSRVSVVLPGSVASLRKAASLDSDDQQHSPFWSDQDGNSGLHLVFERARQFELGVVEREANLRTNLYKNELARMTNRGNTPRVSDRAAHFESLSASQETLDSESDQAPRHSHRKDLALGDDISLVPVAQTSSYAFRDEADRPHTVSTASNQEEGVDSHRHKAVRQNSYLSAVTSASKEASENVPHKVVLDTECKATKVDAGHRKEFQPQYQQKELGKSALLGSHGQSIQKLKAFFGEKTPNIAEASERRPLQELKSNCETTTFKDGWLHCKIAIIDGKRSPDRSWKQMWVVVRPSTLLMYKDRKDVAAQVPSADDHRIILNDCKIDVASDYTKKKHVFRLTTSTNSEYLFQADSSGDMLDWLGCIQESEGGRVLKKTEMFERHLTPKDAWKWGTSRSRSPTGHSPTSKSRKSSQDGGLLKTKTWRGKMVKTIRKIQGASTNPSLHSAGVTIGISLEDCPPSSVSEFVPLLVELCTGIVETKGLDVIGIYRVPGNTAAVSFLLDAVDHGFECLDLQDPRWSDVNVISSLLKAFFRKLPEPLVTCELYSRFIEASKCEDPVQRMYCLKRMLLQLPDHNYETFKFLVGHLRRVVAHSGINKMEARNLAIIFGPTLLRTVDDNMVTMVTDMSYQCRIVELFIIHGDWFFNDDEAEGDASEHGMSVDGLPPRPVAIQNTLLNNAQKMDCGREVPGAKDLVSSIIGAANRKVRQKIKRYAFAVGPNDFDEPNGRHLGTWIPRSAHVEAVTRLAANGVVERRHSEDNATQNASYSMPRKMSVDYLDSLPYGGSRVDAAQHKLSEIGLQTSSGLSNGNVQERIRRFELETKAMLQRDLRRQKKELQSLDSESLKRRKGSEGKKLFPETLAESVESKIPPKIREPDPRWHYETGYILPGVMDVPLARPTASGTLPTSSKEFCSMGAQERSSQVAKSSNRLVWAFGENTKRVNSFEDLSDSRRVDATAYERSLPRYQEGGVRRQESQTAAGIALALHNKPKMCGSLDSLREAYEVSKTGKGCPTVLGGDMMAAASADVQFHRNEDTLIRAVLSTSSNTISTTSTTAVITSTIMQTSSATPARTVQKGGVQVADSQKRLSETNPMAAGLKKGRASPPLPSRKSSQLRSLKRRHTVGGTRDFERVAPDDDSDVGSWTDKALAVSNSNRARPLWRRNYSLRTSSPDLQQQKKEVGISSHPGRDSRPDCFSSLSNQAFLVQVSKSSLESQV